MFAWIGTLFDGILSNYVFGVVSSLMSAIAPVALTAMTIWVFLYGWAVMRGEVSDSVPAFVWKLFKMGLVLTLALEANVYMANVADTAKALSVGVASTFLPGAADPTVITTPYALLDKFNDSASSQVSNIMKQASMFRLDLVLAAALFSIGSVVYLCVALFVITLSTMFLMFVLAIGPLFILSLAWRPTARFFDSWLSMVLNAVVLAWFAFFALGISTYVGTQIFNAIDAGGGFLGGTFNVLGESLRYCVLMILMGILCMQAPSLASALTGGAAIQQGVHMIQNAMTAAGFRSGRSGAGVSAAGGVVRSGTGLPYQAGRATGAAGAAVGRASAAARAALWGSTRR